MASPNKLSPIPHPPKKPVVGNMLSLDATAPIQHMMRLAKELGPIYWLDMMGAPLVVVSGADLVDEVSDEKRFDKSVRGSLRRVRAVGGDGLFTAHTNEPNWSKAHNILMAPFGYDVVHHRIHERDVAGEITIAVAQPQPFKWKPAG